MVKIGVQTKNVVEDANPADGFRLLKRTGFTCADFSLNAYLLNTALYEQTRNRFFDQSEQELYEYFRPHREGAAQAGITVNQMHMPYPVFVPASSRELNDYLQEVVVPKSLKICADFSCPYLVVHGFKLVRQLGSEQAEWERTEQFLLSVAPLAKELGVTICIENLYSGIGGHLIEGPCCDAVKAVQRIDHLNEELGGEVFGFCFDTGHANLVGLDFEEFLTTLGHRLKVLHIHDNDGIADLHQIPFTFAKTRENNASTDWAGFVRGLKNICFDGTLSFETAPVLQAFPPELKEEALRLICKIGEYFLAEL